MSKLEKNIKGNFDEVLMRIEDGILNGSISAKLENSSDFIDNESRCSVRVFERYSAIDNNRVSLSVTLFQTGKSKIHLSAITSGGSKSLFLKVNTFGEKSFLDKFDEIIK